MWICSNCGTQCEGNFCTRCGCRRPRPTPPPAPQYTYTYQPAPQTAAAQYTAESAYRPSGPSGSNATQGGESGFRGVMHRKELKALARRQYRKNWKSAMLCSLIWFLFTMLAAMFVMAIVYGDYLQSYMDIVEIIGDFDADDLNRSYNAANRLSAELADLTVRNVVVRNCAAALIISSVCSVLTSVLSYGMLMIYRGQPAKPGYLFRLHFGKGRFRRILLGNLWVMLCTYVWMLIPFIGSILAVYKSLTYSMSLYLLVECPWMPVTQVTKTSSRMVFGHETQIFVLCLSFLGWAYLGVLTLNILNVLFVTPYIYIAMAGYYDQLKRLHFPPSPVAPPQCGAPPMA